MSGLSLDEDLRLVRERLDELEERLDRIESESADSRPAVVVRTVDGGNYPDASGRAHLCEMVRVSGDEAEGATPTLTPTGAEIVAFNIGAGIPAEGAYTVAEHPPERWVIQNPGEPPE